ncbi:MAG TPA: hypothetical protein VJP80_05485 [Candidatus Saccharimonadales bacterium]|nr:hypothetical protein [Candidatus Saccharimonadales bacterium]
MSTHASSSGGKEVVYIDVDDEITGIIDKVRGSGQKIVALVLPKRATVLQSIVNMKLLKRTADEAKKHIVLITSEAGLLPLAGSVGVHVAKTLQSKPEIPDGPGGAVDDDKSEAIDEADDEGLPVAGDQLDKTKTVGELASKRTASAVGAAALDADDELDDTIELDDEPAEGEDGAESTAPAAAASKKGKNKKLKVPNFNRFRLVVLLAVPVVIALIAGLYVCAAVLPKASIDIKTNSQAIDSSVVVNLKTASDATLDAASATVPATLQSSQKTLSQQVPASGQQNNGQKASGSVTMTAQECGSVSQAADVPAGSAVSASGLTFITQQDTSFAPSKVKNGCIYFVASGATSVVAQTGGSNYNIAASTFTVAGRSDVSASSSAAMSGGTDNITKIVAQADIDSATQKIGQQDTTAVKQELQSALSAKGLLPLPATFNAAAPQTKTSANAGDAADTVTVTQTIQYTMLGAKQSDLQKVIAADVNKKIDPTKQTILDYGLASATFGLQSQTADGASVTMQTTVVAGSDLNTQQIKQQVAGKKAADAESLIKQNPGVTDVNVTYSPFWVSSIPKKTSKITVVVEKPKSTAPSSNANNP